MRLLLDQKIKALENLVRIQDEYIVELKSATLSADEIAMYELLVHSAWCDLTDVEDRMWAPEI